MISSKHIISRIVDYTVDHFIKTLLGLAHVSPTSWSAMAAMNAKIPGITTLVILLLLVEDLHASAFQNRPLPL